jgi:thioredoxin reductase (NADPH)
MTDKTTRTDGPVTRVPSLTIDLGADPASGAVPGAAQADSVRAPAISFATAPISILGSPEVGGSTGDPSGTAHGSGDGRPVETKVLIVGSGPAGLTAAIYAARADLGPVVIAGSAAGGQLMLTSDVENYPGFPDGIQGPDLMAAMRAQAERFGARLFDVDIDRVDLASRPFRVWARGTEYRAEALIVATGASAMWLGIESEERLRGRGVSACATCDGFFFRDKEIAVVGGGDTALEEATYLTRFASKVHLLHRRDAFRGSRIMVDRAVAHEKIEIHYNTAVEEVLGDAHVEGLRLRDTATDVERVISAEGLFIAIGHKPNTEAFRDWLEVDAKGYLVVHDETGSQIEGVFIAGDVHDHRYCQAVTAAGDGCKAALDAERWLEANESRSATTPTISTASAATAR